MACSNLFIGSPEGWAFATVCDACSWVGQAAFAAADHPIEVSLRLLVGELKA
jgi:hypothetical protein